MSVHLHNEKELLVSMSRGDSAAFHTIYYHYSPRIYGKLLKVLHSEDLAAEILQELFTIIWQKREQIDADKSFRSYLFKIADNLVIDAFRKARRDQQLMDLLLSTNTELYTHTEEWLLKKENEALLREAINNLPPQRKLVFILCKIEHKSHEEVSKLLNISSATVNNHLVKATQNLRDYLSGRTDLAGLILAAWILS